MKIEQIEQSLLSPEKKKTAIGLIHRVYLTDLKNARVHTAFTKTKSEVRGGGRKPWRQKGTGNARAGSIRSPLWVGGGVIFGPKPHLVSKKINKKEKQLAILSAFFLKKKECIFLKNDFLNHFENYKTKTMVNFLNKSSVDYKQDKILIILSESNHNFWLSSRNLKNIKITTTACLNVSHLLHANHILISETAFEKINSTQ
jgi:large subunit ribosomal protein L4